MAMSEPLPPRIVAASQENFEELLRLVADYQRFYEVGSIEPERNRRFFGHLLEVPDEGLQFLCYAGQKAVGFATLFFPLSSTRAARYALMNDLYVDPESRGQGIGRMLLEKSRTVAEARGYPDLTWMTAQENTRAQKLYDDFPADKTGWFEYCLSGASSD